MSHIDQALTIWEATQKNGSVEPGAAPADTSALNRFPNEHPSQQAATITAPAGTTTDREAAVVAPRTPIPRPRESHGSLDVEARLVNGAANTVAVEQYRRLAAVLLDLQVHRQLKTVMITSAVPQEGKTLTLANLALTLAESYARRVLVVDADLRWPSLHKLFGVRNTLGLSEALRHGQQDLPIVDVSSRLSVLPAGHPGPSPLAGLASERMTEVIDECAGRYDWVLIDTSPVGVLPDASVFARLVGGVIFVIGAGSTPAAAVERAIAQIGQEAIIGTILNRVEQHRIPAAGYYSHYGVPAPKPPRV